MRTNPQRQNSRPRAYVVAKWELGVDSCTQETVLKEVAVYLGSVKAANPTAPGNPASAATRSQTEPPAEVPGMDRLQNPATAPTAGPGPATATASAPAPAPAPLRPQLRPQLQPQLQPRLHSAPPESGPNVPVATCHERNWYKDDAATMQRINGNIPYREWRLRTRVGVHITPGCDPRRSRSRLDYFLSMFPPEALTVIVNETNKQLRSKRIRETTAGEIIIFFGVMILMSRYEFGERRGLWSSEPSFKYMPAPNFGRTGMSRHRYEEIWSCIRFSFQPQERPPGTSHERWRWMLVEDFCSRDQ